MSADLVSFNHLIAIKIIRFSWLSSVLFSFLEFSVATYKIIKCFKLFLSLHLIWPPKPSEYLQFFSYSFLMNLAIHWFNRLVFSPNFFSYLWIFLIRKRSTLASASMKVFSISLSNTPILFFTLPRILNQKHKILWFFLAASTI